MSCSTVLQQAKLSNLRQINSIISHHSTLILFNTRMIAKSKQLKVFFVIKGFIAKSNSSKYKSTYYCLKSKPIRSCLFDKNCTTFALNVQENKSFYQLVLWQQMNMSFCFFVWIPKLTPGSQKGSHNLGTGFNLKAFYPKWYSNMAKWAKVEICAKMIFRLY